MEYVEELTDIYHFRQNQEQNEQEKSVIGKKEIVSDYI